MYIYICSFWPAAATYLHILRKHTRILYSCCALKANKIHTLALFCFSYIFLRCFSPNKLNSIQKGWKKVFISNGKRKRRMKKAYYFGSTTPTVGIFLQITHTRSYAVFHSSSGGVLYPSRCWFLFEAFREYLTSINLEIQITNVRVKRLSIGRNIAVNCYSTSAYSKGKLGSNRKLPVDPLPDILARCSTYNSPWIWVSPARLIPLESLLFEYFESKEKGKGSRYCKQM